MLNTGLRAGHTAFERQRNLEPGHDIPAAVGIPIILLTFFVRRRVCPDRTVTLAQTDIAGNAR